MAYRDYIQVYVLSPLTSKEAFRVLGFRRLDFWGLQAARAVGFKLYAFNVGLQGFNLQRGSKRRAWEAV